MPDLNFQVVSAEPVPYAAAPAIAFKMSAQNLPEGETIHNVLLTAQIRIESNRRRYTDDEKARLVELFGESDRWGQTLRPLLWTHASMVVTSFVDETSFELHVPCTFDFNVAATKYFDGLSQGSIPLIFLFSGTVFYANSDGVLQASRVSWSKECRYELSVSVWRSLMEMYYPNTAWLTVRKDVLDMLRGYTAKTGLASWEEAVEALLSSPELKPRKEWVV